MAQEARITTVLVDRTEDLMDLWTESMADNVIDLAERQRIEAAMHVVYRQSVDVDESAAIGIALFRLGPDAPRVERLMGERRSRLRLVVRNEFPDNGPRVA